MAPAVPVPMRRPHPNRPPSLAQAAPAAEAPDASQPPETAAEEERRGIGIYPHKSLTVQGEVIGMRSFQTHHHFPDLLLDDF